jgi:lysozyme
MTRTINDAGLNLIKTFEGLKLKAYQDVADIWTIGYGHIKGVHEGMQITNAQAEQFLKDDLRNTETAVASECGAATTDNQFAAMVALAFNIGTGAFATSTVLDRNQAGNTQQAADAFLMWNKAHVNGELTPVAGLTNRRNAERALYLS